MMIIRPKLVKWSMLAAGGLLAGNRLRCRRRSGSLATYRDHTAEAVCRFIGREYRVISSVSAYAWNDYPDRAKIQSLSLMPPRGVRNRFVSYVAPLQPGQRVRIVSAWRHFLLLGFDRYYVVSVPGVGMPEGIRITMQVNSDGLPDRRLYERIGQ
jgi:hypothetical protein